MTGIPNAFFPNIPALSILSRQGSTSVDMPNPGAENPSTEQASVGVQRQITRSMSVSADFIYSLGLHYPRDWNANAIRPDLTYPLEPNGTIMNVNDFGNRIEARQMQLRLERRASERITYRAAYTWMDVKAFASAVDDNNRNADAKNYGGFIGNQRSPDFGKPTYALARFQGQLGIRFDF